MDARSLVATLAIIFLLWLIRTWIRWDGQARLASESRQRIKNRLIDSSLSQRVGIGSANRSPTYSSSMGADIDSADEGDPDRLRSADGSQMEEEHFFTSAAPSGLDAVDSEQLETLRMLLQDRDDTIRSLQQSLATAQRELDSKADRLYAQSPESAGDLSGSASSADPDSSENESSQKHVSDHEGVTSSSADSKARLQDQLAALEAQAKATNQSDPELRRLRGELDSVQPERTSAAEQLQSLEVRVRKRQDAMARSVQHPNGDTGGVQLQRDFLEPGQGVDTSAVVSRNMQGAQTNTDGERATNGGNDSRSTWASGKPESKNTRQKSEIKTPLYQAPSDKDDLKLIKGIGPVMERTLNELGVTTFRQLANFTQIDIDKVSAAIGAFPGRIERDDWVGRARQLVRDQRPV